MLDVHAHPGARRRGVRVDDTGRVRVEVLEPADRGKANDAVIDALAEVLGVRRASLELVSGHTTRRKRIRVHGMSERDLAAVLDRLREVGPR